MYFSIRLSIYLYLKTFQDARNVRKGNLYLSQQQQQG